MLKNFRSLFIKTDEEEAEKPSSKPDSFSFPVNNFPVTPSSQPPVSPPPPISDPTVAEVLKVYETGLDSINMPGYDFYEFYQSVNTAGDTSEQAYKMAYKMAKIFDKGVTPAKLIHDAEFYISKINEVHSQYVAQGKAKLNAIQDKKTAEKSALSGEIEQASAKINQLKAEIQRLEAEVASKSSVLAKIDETYRPQEKLIQDRSAANDFAHKTSIDKLNSVKDGISKYVNE
jgi:cell division protein FtsB